jgi:Caspase domain
MFSQLSKGNLDNSEKRLALVIGNGQYTSGYLVNAQNDVRDVTAVLQELGFIVLKYENLNQGQMIKAIDDFGMKLKGFQTGIFYYTGHGIQAKGINYLIPVDAQIKTEEQVEYDCVKAERIINLMEASGTNNNIIILDACRNNPFEERWTRLSTGRGLVKMDAPRGTIIAYSASPGSTTSDDSGKINPYTSALIENIQLPNCSIIQVFQKIQNKVSERTNNSQIPWESSSLSELFFFKVDEKTLNENIVSTSQQLNNQVYNYVDPKTTTSSIKKYTELQRIFEWSSYALLSPVKSFVEQSYTAEIKNSIYLPKILLDEKKIIFDSQGLLKEETITSHNNDIPKMYKNRDWAKKGKVTSLKFFRSEGQVIKVASSNSQTVRNYDLEFPNDTIVKDNEFQDKAIYLIKDSRIIKTYLEGWRGTQDDLLDKNGTLKELWNYNNKGLLEAKKDPLSLLPLESIEYLEFDIHGNWVRKLVKTSANTYYILLREYTY